MTMDAYLSTIDLFNDYDVYDFNGPNSAANTATICDNLDYAC
jgi:hypothetical protein